MDARVIAPGPNDYHLDETGTLMPGLGQDEPTADEKAGIRSMSMARARELKAQLVEQGAVLSERERELVKKEREIEARERKLADAEKKAAKPPTS